MTNYSTLMAHRLSFRISNQNDWLVDAIEKERIEQSRSSVNNTIEAILVSYFNNKKSSKKVKK